MTGKIESAKLAIAHKQAAEKANKVSFSTIGGILVSSVEIAESYRITNELATEISKCVDYKPWHINWITRSSAGVVQAWEPDNTCIYEGPKLNAACRALKLSTYGN